MTESVGAGRSCSNALRGRSRSLFFSSCDRMRGRSFYRLSSKKPDETEATPCGSALLPLSLVPVQRRWVLRAHGVQTECALLMSTQKAHIFPLSAQPFSFGPLGLAHQTTSTVLGHYTLYIGMAMATARASLRSASTLKHVPIDFVKHVEVDGVCTKPFLRERTRNGKPHGC